MESGLPAGGCRGGDSESALPFPFHKALGTVLPESQILRTPPLEAPLEVDTFCLNQTLLVLLGAVPRCAPEGPEKEKRMDSHNLRKNTRHRNPCNDSPTQVATHHPHSRLLLGEGT